ncbi:hypothetical protein [Clostridium sardiniense]|uniref:hypothetical protein n=1 Tax=Clostridium sardiniense TaxID=29369 RepID=UPI003D355B00
MKPDKKYMSITDEENEFEAFEASAPYNNLNSGWAPIINVDSLDIENFHGYRSNKIPYSLGSQIDLRDQAINDALGVSSELYSYNNTSSTPIDTTTGVPTPTDILREFDMDLDENELLGSYTRYGKKCNPEQVFQRIRANNPLILKTMESYRIPFPIAKTLIKRIIALSNIYCSRE